MSNHVGPAANQEEVLYCGSLRGPIWALTAFFLREGPLQCDWQAKVEEYYQFKNANSQQL